MSTRHLGLQMRRVCFRRRSSLLPRYQKQIARRVFGCLLLTSIVLSHIVIKPPVARADTNAPSKPWIRWIGKTATGATTISWIATEKRVGAYVMNGEGVDHFDDLKAGVTYYYSENDAVLRRAPSDKHKPGVTQMYEQFFLASLQGEETLDLEKAVGAEAKRFRQARKEVTRDGKTWIVYTAENGRKQETHELYVDPATKETRQVEIFRNGKLWLTIFLDYPEEGPATPQAFFKVPEDTKIIDVASEEEAKLP